MAAHVSRYPTPWHLFGKVNIRTHSKVAVVCFNGFSDTGSKSDFACSPAVDIDPIEYCNQNVATLDCNLVVFPDDARGLRPFFLLLWPERQLNSRIQDALRC